MTKEELKLIQSGGANLEYHGNVYECVGEQNPLGFIYSDVNDAYSITMRDEDLLADETAQMVHLTHSQYIAKTHSCDSENKALFEQSEYAVALLQVRPDLPEKRDISFESYEQACKYLGDGKKPVQDMYWNAHVEPMTKERLDDIGKHNSSQFYQNIGNYMFEKMNNPETLPSVLDGYYGTSASVSNVVLIKEKDEMTALYIEPTGYKLLEDFAPEKQAEPLKGMNKLKAMEKE